MRSEHLGDQKWALLACFSFFFHFTENSWGDVQSDPFHTPEIPATAEISLNQSKK